MSTLYRVNWYTRSKNPANQYHYFERAESVLRSYKSSRVHGNIKIWELTRSVLEPEGYKWQPITIEDVISNIESEKLSKS